MIRVFRIKASEGSPRLALTDHSEGHPADWVRGLRIPDFCVRERAAYRVLAARVDRPARHREFCALEPGTLSVPVDALDDESGPTSMYYALWWQQYRIDLEADGMYYACIVPKLTLEPDPRSGAPCPIDGVYASVFRIAGRPPEEIYCTSGVVTGGDEFPGIYHEEGFSGLDFETVWEGDASDDGR